MVQKVISVRGGSAEAYVFDVVGEELVNKTLINSIAGDVFSEVELSVDDQYLIVFGDLSDQLAVAQFNDGQPGPYGAVISTGSSVSWIAPSPADPTIFATGHFNNPKSIRVWRINGDLSLSEIASIGSLAQSPGVGGSFNDAGDRLVFGTTTTLHLYSFDGAALSALDTLGVFPGGADRVDPRWIPGTSRIFAGNSNHTQIVLVTAVGDSLVSLDTAAQESSSFSGVDVSKSGIYAFHGARSGTDDARIWPLGETSFGTSVAFPQPAYDGAFLSDSLIATIDDSVNEIETRLYSFDGSSLTLVFEDASLADAQTVRIIATNPETGPDTPQELFNASYADASAAPPKITALIQPADVQRTIDTDVFNLTQNAKYHSVDYVIELGEISTYQPGLPYFVRADQPGLREGKILLLKKPPIFRDALPHVPATLLFWG